MGDHLGMPIEEESLLEENIQMKSRNTKSLFYQSHLIVDWFGLFVISSASTSLEDFLFE